MADERAPDPPAERPADGPTFTVRSVRGGKSRRAREWVVGQLVRSPPGTTIEWADPKGTITLTRL